MSYKLHAAEVNGGLQAEIDEDQPTKSRKYRFIRILISSNRVVDNLQKSHFATEKPHAVSQNFGVSQSQIL